MGGGTVIAKESTAETTTSTWKTPMRRSFACRQRQQVTQPVPQTATVTECVWTQEQGQLGEDVDDARCLGKQTHEAVRISRTAFVNMYVNMCTGTVWWLSGLVLRGCCWGCA